MAASQGNGGRTNTAAVAGAENSVIDGLEISFDATAKPATITRGRTAEPLPPALVSALEQMAKLGAGNGVVKVGPIKPAKFTLLVTKANKWLKVNAPAFKVATTTVDTLSDDRVIKQISLAKV